MPYIKKKQRDRLSSLLESIVSTEIKDAGELNYIVTCLVQDYIVSSGRQNYQGMNDVIGVLECAKLELYRRLIADLSQHMKA